MLERTAGCLESGGLRRLLPVSKKSLKSRRSLHSCFWSHGANDLELSPLWAILLRGTESINNDTQSHQNGNGGPGSFLLDFLYPAGTINLLQMCSSWGVDRQDGRKIRAMRRVGHRLYTSSTKDTSGDQKLIEDSQDNVHERSIRVDTDLETLRHLMESTEPPDYEGVWTHYLRLSEANRRVVRRRVVESLSKSTKIRDAERSTDLFSQLQQEGKDISTYEAVIRSFLSLRDFPQAMQYHHEALQKCGSPAGSAELLAYLVENSLWPESFTIWSDFQNNRDQFPQVNYNIYDALKDDRNLSRRVSNLIQYVDTAPELASGLKGFAGRLVRTALLSERHFEEGAFTFLLETLQRWKLDNPSVYQESIRFLLQLGNARLAVQSYRKARKLQKVHLTQPTLHALLKTFCDSGSVVGMQEVLDDFFRFHGKLTRSAYYLTSTYFASQGDATTVHALFEQYTNRFRLEGNLSVTSDVLAPVLTVYAKRGELDKVIKHFNQIEEVYHMQPTILCWNILISAYGKVQDTDGAFDKFRTVLNSPKLRPDDYTFGTIMGICATRGDRDSVIEIWELAKNKGIKPSTAMIDCLVQAFIQDDQLTQAETICEDAVHQALEGSHTRMWNCLLLAYAMRRDLRNVNRILQRMSELKIEYNHLTYSALMQALAMVKQPWRAEAILTDILPEAGIKLTNFHYAIVMGGWLAFGSIDRVFQLHSQMVDRDMGKSASTSLLALKASLVQDKKFSAFTTEEARLQQALELFEGVAASFDPQDIAVPDRKGVGRMPLDIAYSSMFYGYFMFVLAQYGDSKGVDELYGRFSKVLGDRKDKTPLRILTALMASKLKESDHAGVSQIWDMAFVQAKKDGQKLPVTAESLSLKDNTSTVKPKDTEILHHHRFDLSQALTFYLKSIDQCNNVDEIIRTVADLQATGFVLDSQNWNHYIQILARRYKWNLAFELCETKLMGGFTGWARLRARLPGVPNKLPGEHRRLSKHPGYLRPKSVTLLYLARAFLDLQAAGAESRGSESLIEHLERTCPKTLQAIKAMQRLNDEQEREILGTAY